LLAIFNGPYGNLPAPPAFVIAATQLKNTALFQSFEHHQLLWGPFESEGCLYQAKGNTYVEDCGDY
jgi:hypothetical protein